MGCGQLRFGAGGCLAGSWAGPSSAKHSKPLGLSFQPFGRATIRTNLSDSSMASLPWRGFPRPLIQDDAKGGTQVKGAGPLSKWDAVLDLRSHRRRNPVA